MGLGRALARKGRMVAVGLNPGARIGGLVASLLQKRRRIESNVGKQASTLI